MKTEKQGERARKDDSLQTAMNNCLKLRENKETRIVWQNQAVREKTADSTEDDHRFRETRIGKNALRETVHWLYRFVDDEFLFKTSRNRTSLKRRINRWWTSKQLENFFCRWFSSCLTMTLMVFEVSLGQILKYSREISNTTISRHRLTRFFHRFHLIDRLKLIEKCFLLTEGIFFVSLTFSLV